MLDRHPMEDRLVAVVLDGRRRLLRQSALRDALFGATIMTAGPAALLALGTDYFPPALLWLFLAAGAAAGLYRWMRSQPPAYRVAQLLDRRWQADDQVSTAYYFLKESARQGVVAEQQRAAASHLAAGGDLVAALPFRMPQAAWGLLVMLALVAGLFTLRYALQPALSLRTPLPAMLLTALLGSDHPAETADRLEPEALRARDGSEESAPSLGDEAETRDAQSRASSPQGAESGPDARPEQRADALDIETPQVEGLSLNEPYGDEMDYNSLAKGEQQAQQGDQKGNSPSDKGAASDQKGQPGANQDSKPDGWNQQPDSLLDRLKDAFRNMLAKMNMDPPKSAQSKQSAASDPNSQSETMGESAEGGEGQSQGSANSSGEAKMEGGEPGDANSQQVMKGEGGDNSSQPGQGQPASAAGGNDGSKEIQDAAQLEEAMGRLEELYVRRAEEIRGEVMIETETAKQTARTPYQPKNASHSDLGGTVSRDAIPLAYQSYIKSYFENLRTKN